MWCVKWARMTTYATKRADDPIPNLDFNPLPSGACHAFVPRSGKHHDVPRAAHVLYEQESLGMLRQS